MANSLTQAQLRQRSDAGKIGGRIGGKKGGQTVVEKYGYEHFSRLGKLGGRPTWQEALAKAHARQAELDAQRVKPGRPRKSRPVMGERKELTAPTVAYQEPIIQGLTNG